MLSLKPKLWEIPDIPQVVKQNLDAKIIQLKERLQQVAKAHRSARLASSLAVEDMLITDVIAKNNIGIEVFTLDTLLLNKETLALIEQVKIQYPTLAFRVYQPKADDVQDYESTHGKLAFYKSTELRHACCGIRKVVPLNRALQGADAWLTGQRQAQSVTRVHLPFSEQDQQRGIAKYNPIFDWSEVEVWAYILRFHIPYNLLYLKGYPSIGCEPCTRPVKCGEAIRAGRWWWESQDSKECGLHTHES